MTEHAAAPEGGFTMGEATANAFTKRPQRFVLLRATLVFLGLSLLLYGVLAYVTREAAADYLAWASEIAARGGFQAGETPPPPPQSVLDAIPPALVVGLLYCLVMAAYEAACLRWLARGEAGGGVFGFKLDADTARVFLVYLTWIGVLLATYAVVVGVAFALGMLLSLLRAPVGLFLALSPLVLITAMIFVGVRFAPAAASSVALKRYAFFRAWAVTKGRGWSLFGAFAFVFVLYVVGALMIYAAFALTTLSGAVAAFMEAGGAPDPEAIHAITASPGALVGIALMNLALVALYQISLITLFGVNAYAAAFAQREGRI